MAESTVLAHDAPVEILPDILFIHGRMRMGPGMTINRNMIAVRSHGDVTLLNPVRLSAEGEKALEAYGNVRHAVRLGMMHGVDDAYTVERFGAEFWAPEGEADYAEPRPDHLLREGGDLPIPDADLFLFRESKRPEACLQIRRDGGLLVACDAIQHWTNTSNCSLPAKLVTHLMGFVHTANIGPPWKKMMTKPGGSLRPDFERLLERPFENLVGAHGEPLLGGANAALRQTVQRVFA